MSDAYSWGDEEDGWGHSCIGPDCIHPSFYHSIDECHTAEMMREEKPYAYRLGYADALREHGIGMECPDARSDQWA